MYRTKHGVIGCFVLLDKDLNSRKDTNLVISRFISCGDDLFIHTSKNIAKMIKQRFADIGSMIFFSIALHTRKIKKSSFIHLKT
jgi:hypothetical protein